MKIDDLGVPPFMKSPNLLLPLTHGHGVPTVTVPRREFGFTNIQRERFGQALLNGCGGIVHDLNWTGSETQDIPTLVVNLSYGKAPWLLTSKNRQIVMASNINIICICVCICIYIYMYIYIYMKIYIYIYEDMYIYICANHYRRNIFHAMLDYQMVYALWGSV